MPIRPRALTTLGHVVECDGVQIRAQLRSVATLVRVTGRCTAVNRKLMTTHLRRFTLIDGPLVLDLLGSDGFDGDMLQDLVDTIADLADSAGTDDVTLVVDPTVRDVLPTHDGIDVVGSVAHALRNVVERVNTRRAFAMASSTAGNAAVIPSGARHSRETA